MASILTERADEILNRALRQLVQNTQITRLSAGSKARALLGIISTEIEKMEDISTANMMLTLLNGASGIYLDFIGDLVGVDREARLPARVTESDQVIRISSPTGFTFGNLNSGNDIFIPSGTAITSENGDIKYLIDQGVTLQPANNTYYVAAHAAVDGSGGNVNSGILTVLDFDNYTAHPDIQLEVTNISSIENGATEEDDEFYRYRIRNALLSREAANRTAIRLELLSIPSISDVVMLDLYRGIGTANIVLDTETGEVSSLTREAVTRALDRVKATGMDIRAIAPDLVGLTVDITIKYKTGTTSSGRIEVQRDITDKVSQLVALIPLGGTLLLNDLADTIREAHGSILDIGRPNKPLDEVVLWRDSAITDRAPVTLRRTDINLNIDERLTLEGAPTEAISIIEL